MESKPLRYLVAFGALIAFIIFSIVSWCDQTTVYIVRHAERAAGVNNPPLTPDGETRAIALKDLLLNNKSVSFTPLTPCGQGQRHSHSLMRSD